MCHPSRNPSIGVLSLNLPMMTSSDDADTANGMLSCPSNPINDATSIQTPICTHQDIGPPPSCEYHRLVILWNALTILITLTIGTYSTHVNIVLQDGKELSWIISYFTQVWCTIDILLNFSKNNHKTKYLTTWFLLDVACMLSWETTLVKPFIILMQKENFFIKVVKFLRLLSPSFWKHYSRHIIRIGRFIRSIGYKNKVLLEIAKVIPHYVIFFQKMYVVLILRMLRQIRWNRRLLESVLVYVQK